VDPRGQEAGPPRRTDPGCILQDRGLEALETVLREALAHAAHRGAVDIVVPASKVLDGSFFSARTNRMIGGKAPNVYLAGLQRSAGIEPARMDEILRSHLIDQAALRADDFDRFFEARSQALLEKIAKAMGKAIAREAVEEAELPEHVEYEAEETEEVGAA
jgi:hypothetical protein